MNIYNFLVRAVIEDVLGQAGYAFLCITCFVIMYLTHTIEKKGHFCSNFNIKQQLIYLERFIKVLIRSSKSFVIVRRIQ